ncbi:hypothetical protein EG329_000808 [Mollisiaceae sp. DMI_Dod_QoI]|nr:hypothetical protein EG329_000808 [Helotiales sp. DMI_Dod_QoI]
MTSRPEDMEARLKLDSCFDRGQKYLNVANKTLWDNKVKAINRSLDAVNQEFSKERLVIDRIEATQSTTIEDEPIAHLQALRRAITPKLVQEVLEEYKVYAGETQLMEAAALIWSSYCKIFAILLKCNQGKSIIRFLDQNIDDSNLPLQSELRDRNYIISLKKGLFTIKDWAAHDWQNFFRWQWSFMTPFFARPDGKVLHYCLKSKDILPIIATEDYEREEKDHRENGNGSETQEPLQIKRKYAAYGGHSTVSKIKLNPLSCDFGEFPFQNRDGWYELKQLTGKFTREDFLSEIYVWKLFNGEGDKLHTSPLLCTFEKSDGNKREYFLLFPWASGDLRQLWQNKSSRDGQHTSHWMAEQCWRIAEALSVIHQDEETDPIRADGDGERLYGRHGDIKPGNILWFGEHVECKGAGTLVLADFGIAKAHRSMTKSLSDPEKAKNSPTYKSPEFESNGLKIGRKSDIWGLACTWIEFLTWFLKGWQAVDIDFPKGREETDPKDKNISRDTYFSVVNGSPIIKPGVVEWMNELHEDNNCSPFVDDFLTFIEEHMLLVNPVKRAPACTVALKMKGFFERIKEHSRYSESPCSSTNGV